MFFIRTTLHSRRLEIVNDPPILRGLVVRDTAGTPPSSPSVVTFASASPAATSGVSNGLSPLGTSSMYLYIFLATLGVILAIAIAMLSGAFVSRSRRRREIDEAMRNGSYVVMNRNNEGVMMQKPLIYDAFVEDHDYHSMMNQTGKWEDIVPVSAGLLTRSGAEGHSEGHLRSRDRPRPQAGLANDTHNSSPVHTSPTTTKVSVLIAMPSPHPLPRSTPYGKAKMVELDDSDRSMSEFSFEEHDLDLPMVEFGIVEVPVVRNARMDPGRRLSETTSESGRGT